MSMKESTQARRHRLALEWWAQCTTEEGIPFHAVARGLRCTYHGLQTRIDAGEVRVQRIGERWEWPVNVDDAYRLLGREIGLGRV
jgi:hypothetical protein